MLKPKSLRGAGAVAATAILALTVSACGSSSSASSGQSSSGSSSSSGGHNPLASAKVQACLKKQGVTLPSRGQGRPPGGTSGGQGPAGGAPPNGGQPPSGATGGQGPSGATPPGANSAQFQKLQKALKACGVTMPQGGPPGGQAPSATGTSSNS